MIRNLKLNDVSIPARPTEMPAYVMHDSGDANPLPLCRSQAAKLTDGSPACSYVASVAARMNDVAVMGVARCCYPCVWSQPD